MITNELNIFYTYCFQSNVLYFSSVLEILASDGLFRPNKSYNIPSKWMHECSLHSPKFVESFHQVNADINQMKLKINTVKWVPQMLLLQTKNIRRLTTAQLLRVLHIIKFCVEMNRLDAIVANISLRIGKIAGPIEICWLLPWLGWSRLQTVWLVGLISFYLYRQIFRFE